MANTTNYNWETPDDTDLVKDGAAAIRTLGSSVDTTTKALNPSTTLGDIEYRSATANTNTRLGIGSSGQVLTVAAGVPSWATPTVGDITEVSAGTGISGGGTSGAITITNDMATTITASGDIVVGTGSGTYDNLPIGTTGEVLTADTTVSPYKVKWAAAASSIPANSFATVATYQSTTSTSYTDLTTSGPAVTVTTGTKALVIVTSVIEPAKNNEGYMSYAVSGATTVAASDATALLFYRNTTDGVLVGASKATSVTLTAGSNTFTAKYKSGGGGSINFSDRSIFVINLA